MPGGAISMHNHKQANAKNSLHCTILHCNFCIEKDHNRPFSIY